MVPGEGWGAGRGKKWGRFNLHLDFSERGDRLGEPCVWHRRLVNIIKGDYDEIAKRSSGCVCKFYLF